MSPFLFLPITPYPYQFFPILLSHPYTSPTYPYLYLPLPPPLPLSFPFPSLPPSPFCSLPLSIPIIILDPLSHPYLSLYIVPHLSLLSLSNPSQYYPVPPYTSLFFYTPPYSSLSLYIPTYPSISLIPSLSLPNPLSSSLSLFIPT